jgi:hypothetical protein
MSDTDFPSILKVVNCFCDATTTHPHAVPFILFVAAIYIGSLIVYYKFLMHTTSYASERARRVHVRAQKEKKGEVKERREGEAREGKN